MFNGFNGADADEKGSWHEPDFVLAYLVSSLVNLAGTPLGVTLMVKGVVITGTLMSEREYLETLTRMLQSQVRRSLSGLNEEDREMAEAAFDLTDLTEDFYPDSKEEIEEGEEVDFEMGMQIISHVHLKDPMVISPQPSISFTDGIFPIMRIRLSNIDGWMLGTSMPGFGDLLDDGGIRH